MVMWDIQSLPVMRYIALRPNFNMLEIVVALVRKRTWLYRRTVKV